jgi:hypothetical protein
MAQPDAIRSFAMTMFAEHYQFYLRDGDSDPGELSVYWPQEMRDQMVLLKDTIIGIGTVRSIEVPVQLDIFQERPEDEYLDDYDQVIECQLSVPSGKLAVSGATEDFCESQEIELAAGQYGVRIYWGALDEVDVEGFEGEDYYRISVWRTDKAVPYKMLKQWQPRHGEHLLQ